MLVSRALGCPTHVIRLNDLPINPNSSRDSWISSACSLLCCVRLLQSSLNRFVLKIFCATRTDREILALDDVALKFNQFLLLVGSSLNKLAKRCRKSFC